MSFRCKWVTRKSVIVSLKIQYAISPSSSRVQSKYYMSLKKSRQLLNSAQGRYLDKKAWNYGLCCWERCCSSYSTPGFTTPAETAFPPAPQAGLSSAACISSSTSILTSRFPPSQKIRVFFFLLYIFSFSVVPSYLY